MSSISDRVSQLQPSLIREVAEAGMLLPDVTPLWFGESAWPSSDLAVDSAVQALRDSDHFYQPNSGRLSLRDALCAYQIPLYGCPLERERVTVTASAMQGLMLSSQALVSPGDKVVYVDPAWPNMAECFRLQGAEVHAVSLQAVDDRWHLDMTRLLDLIGADTRVVAVNSPSNPTGWVMSQAEQRHLLEHCRATGTWIVSDEVYARLYQHGRVAPGFLAIAEPEDRLVVVNSFSKAWSMTGWRLGWLTAPADLEPVFAMLSEYNIAGPPGFVQRAGETMLARGESEIARLQSRLAEGYALTRQVLGELERVRFVAADGAFYSFFSVDGMADSLAFAKRVLHGARVGLAPGAAFGAAGEGFLRLCYAQPPEVLGPALQRLAKSLTAA